MNGLIMDYPLTVPAILKRAAQIYPEKEIVSRLSDGRITRANYGELYERVVRLMNVLRDLGVRPGDRVATCAWNSQRHLELYFAIPCLGAVLHTVNHRLSTDQIEYIVNHAEDHILFLDKSVAGMIAELQPKLPQVQHFVVMEDYSEPPSAYPTPYLDYETLLASASNAENFPDIDERAASGLCYTSGTTGDPKGVLYSHRSMYLHSMGVCLADSIGVSERDTVLPVVPMFHVNAWGLPYACAMTGAKQVLPGRNLLGAPIASLIESERVTLTAGVPTVWKLLHQHLKQHSYDTSSLHTIVVGGSAMPASMIDAYEKDFGIKVLCLWGMTETSPVATISRLRAGMSDLSPSDQLKVRAKQGIPLPGLEIGIRGDGNEVLDWDSEQVGEVVIRGAWITSGYYKDERNLNALTPDGWFKTGDIAKVDRFGYMEITDRKKDVIKSRGEWISSVDMENLIVQHTDVLEACVVGRPDANRDEAPVAFVVLSNERPHEAMIEEIIVLLGTHFASWQLPRRGDFHFVEALPKTSVGKLDKKVLRARLEAGLSE